MDNLQQDANTSHNKLVLEYLNEDSVCQIGIFQQENEKRHLVIFL